MIKVLIVDDEYIVRYGLKSTIEWEKYGYCVVAEAKNGETALEAIRRDEPDVVITDVMMPVMDGIELIYEASKINPSIEFVILSGFNDFEYVRSALRLGVSDYLIKPIQNNELVDILIKIKNKIESKRNYNDTIKNYEAKIPIIRQGILNDILEKNITSEEELIEKISLGDMESFKLPYFVVMFDTENIKELKTGINEISLGNNVILSVLNERLFMIVSIDDSRTITMMATNLIKRLGENNINVDRVYISNVHETPLAFRLAYKELESLESLYGTKIKSEIVVLDEVIEDAELIKKTIDENIDILLDKNKKLLRLDAVNNLCAMLYIISDIRKCIFVCNTINRKLDIEEDRSFFEKYSDATVDEIVEVLRGLITNNMSREIVWKSYQKNNYGAETIKMIEYVVKNFSEDINIDTIAEALFRSPYYLMHMFKNDTGESFKQYVINYRMEVAKDLLAKREYKIYEVGEKVGYKNVKYFTSAFKRYTGYTPKEYRTNVLMSFGAENNEE